jgi:hypothetical protein
MMVHHQAVFAHTEIDFMVRMRTLILRSSFSYLVW